MFHVIYNNYFQQHNYGDNCPMVTYNYIIGNPRLVVAPMFLLLPVT